VSDDGRRPAGSACSCSGSPWPQPRSRRAGRFRGAPSCPLTPSTSFWHADISSVPVAPQFGGLGLEHRDVGGPQGRLRVRDVERGPIRIPYTTVPATQPSVPVSFEYADESDPGPYPVPADAPIRVARARRAIGTSSSSIGMPAAGVSSTGAYPRSGGASWTAGSGLRTPSPRHPPGRPTRLWSGCAPRRAIRDAPPPRATQLDHRPNEPGDHDRDGARQQLVLASAAAVVGTLSLEVAVSLAAGLTAQVDDLSLRRS
jgi:hypothetical protein